jgi:hypothetical protein
VKSKILFGGGRGSVAGLRQVQVILFEMGACCSIDYQKHEGPLEKRVKNYSEFLDKYVESPFFMENPVLDEVDDYVEDYLGHFTKRRFFSPATAAKKFKEFNISDEIQFVWHTHKMYPCRYHTSQTGVSLRTFEPNALYRDWLSGAIIRYSKKARIYQQILHDRKEDIPDMVN